MKNTKSLALRSQHIRNLTQAELRVVLGGVAAGCPEGSQQTGGNCTHSHRTK
ncbi:hypothetical protein [Mycobacterium sp.]|uniref:hypothetical protein n=1 Tax=Mycobacterium sp. TaxID=1785 RepID=UPI002C68D91A|nr:hypothetical protein [Mycobacterium sp.]HTQ18973.1 hypothetical protein [Mycobacterium sp.]